MCAMLGMVQMLSSEEQRNADWERTQESVRKGDEERSAEAQEVASDDQAK